LLWPTCPVAPAVRVVGKPGSATDHRLSVGVAVGVVVEASFWGRFLRLRRSAHEKTAGESCYPAEHNPPSNSHKRVTSFSGLEKLNGRRLPLRRPSDLEIHLLPRRTTPTTDPRAAMSEMIGGEDYLVATALVSAGSGCESTMTSWNPVSFRTRSSSNAGTLA
jgi:hypothetical protein